MALWQLTYLPCRALLDNSIVWVKNKNKFFQFYSKSSQHTVTISFLSLCLSGLYSQRRNNQFVRSVVHCTFQIRYFFTNLTYSLCDLFNVTTKKNALLYSIASLKHDNFVNYGLSKKQNYVSTLVILIFTRFSDRKRKKVLHWIILLQKYSFVLKSIQNYLDVLT